MDNSNVFNKKGLNFVHLNIRSLFVKNKFEMFKQQLLNSNIHFMGISESWLRDELPSNILDIDGYNLVRYDRIWEENDRTKKGGGVCIYIKKDLVYSEFKYSHMNLSSKNIEIQWISLKQPNMREIIIANLYRPPQGSIKIFCQKLNESLLVLNALNNKEIILMGDFNINALNDENTDTKELTNLMSSFGLQQMIKESTRFGMNKKCIDHIYSNSDFILNSGTLQWNYSDHYAIFINRKKAMNKYQKIEFTGRSYKNYSKEDFQDNLRMYDWNNFFVMENPDECWSILYDRIISTLDDMCPEKTFRISSYKEPWMNKDIMELIIDKDKALHRAKKSNSSLDWDIAKRLRNEVGKIVESAKRNYLEEEFLSSKKDPKRFWRNIYSIIPNNKNSKKGKIHLNDDEGNSISYDNTANYINDFFSNIGPNLAKKYDKEWTFFDRESENQLNDLKFNKGILIDFIKNIEINKSSGLDKISSKCLKDALMVLSSQLAHIFEISIKNGMFPNEWKKGTIVPLYKGGNREDVSNYRPVSLLPIPGKLLEHFIHDHITEFFEANNLLCSHQGGFRKGHSTLNTISDFTADIFNAINKKEITVAVFIDLKKAFDTVNHSILLKKLCKMGIKGQILDWILDYLKGRSQKTICNGNLSNSNEVLCGVPQGSILGPLLFLVYINDMEYILNNIKFQLYADDTVLYCSGKDSLELQYKLQNGLDSFVEWCEINKLTINTKKTKVMTFGTRFNIKKVDIELKVNNETLQSVPTYRYLGIILDQTLNFNCHLKKVVNNISHKLYIFSKIRRFLNDQSALIVYKSMILPYFDYSDVVFMFSNFSLLSKLDRLHLRGLKISKCTNTGINENDLLTLCNISNLENRRIVHLRNFLFNKKHLCISTENMNDRIITRSISGPTFNINKPNCEAYKRSICYSGMLNWNSLDPEIRKIDNIILFKRHQKSWLLNTYLN